MNRDQKAAVVDEIAAQIDESDAVFAVDYRGISVPEAAALRVRLREADATFRVVKNSLTERAVAKAGADSLTGLLDGPTAFTFVRGDAATAAKALADFARSTDTLAFKGGVMGSEALDADQITSISRLPSRDTLNAQLVGIVASPLTGVARSLSALVGGLASQLRQIAEQGLVSGAEPEAPAPAAEPPAEAAESEAPDQPTEPEPEPEQADASADAAPDTAAEAKEES